MKLNRTDAAYIKDNSLWIQKPARAALYRDRFGTGYPVPRWGVILDPHLN
jgi:hypothetical protein